MPSFSADESSHSAAYFLNVGNLRDTGHSAEATPPAAMAEDQSDTMNNTITSFCLAVPVNASNCQIQKAPLTIGHLLIDNEYKSKRP